MKAECNAKSGLNIYVIIMFLIYDCMIAYAILYIGILPSLINILLWTVIILEINIFLIYFILCFLNWNFTVSEEGIIFYNAFRKKREYNFDEVIKATHYHNRSENKIVLIMSDGKKIRIKGTYRGFTDVHDCLVENKVLN